MYILAILIIFTLIVSVIIFYNDTAICAVRHEKFSPNISTTIGLHQMEKVKDELGMNINDYELERSLLSNQNIYNPMGQIKIRGPAQFA